MVEVLWMHACFYNGFCSLGALNEKCCGRLPLALVRAEFLLCLVGIPKILKGQTVVELFLPKDMACETSWCDLKLSFVSSPMEIPDFAHKRKSYLMTTMDISACLAV